MNRMALLVVLAACGGPDVDLDGTGGGSHAAGGGATGGGGQASTTTSESNRNALSGSRLKVQNIVGDDGARVFYGFHDAMRNEDCQFQLASDGVLRCLPIAGAASVNVSVFADSNCTQPIATVSNCTSSTVSYAFEYGTVQCGKATYVMHTVSPISTVYSMQYVGANYSCAESQPTPNTSYFSITGTVDPTDFQGGMVSVE